MKLLRRWDACTKPSATWSGRNGRRLRTYSHGRPQDTLRGLAHRVARRAETRAALDAELSGDFSRAGTLYEQAWRSAESLGPGALGSFEVYPTVMARRFVGVAVTKVGSVSILLAVGVLTDSVYWLSPA